MLGRRDDHFVAHLARARRRPVKDTAPRARFAVNHVRRNPRARVFVPDIHEFKREYARSRAMLGVKRDRAVIGDIGARHAKSMQFCPDNLDHALIFKPPF